MWPLAGYSSDPNAASNVNGDQDMTFDEAVNSLIEAYNTKFSWLDGKKNAMQ